MRYLMPIATFLLGIACAFVYMLFTDGSSPAAITINPPLPTKTPGPIRVYINGEVNKPDVYELPRGSRVEALLEMAGGVTEDADESGINIAALLTDGAQVFIANSANSANEADTAVYLSAAPERATINTSTTVDSADNVTADGGALININTADRDQLEEIPGVGESTAGKIMAYREENGPFRDIEAIMNVSGIGESKFDAMRNVITVSQ